MAHSAGKIETVKQELEVGITSPDIIALRTGLHVAVVEEILHEINKAGATAKSNVEVMRDNLDLLQDLLDTAQWEYRTDPNVDNSSALVQMIQTSLSTIKEIESRKDPAVIMNEILGRAIQPLFRDVIKYVTGEAGRARDDLYEGLPREYHARVDEALKSLVKGMGRATGGDYKRTVEILATVLECKAADEKVRPLLQPVKEESNEPAKESAADR